ncbi:MAG: malate dehydrogenase [Spirochaetaceae bacterium 4572_59]|nr:MAG: malate dehydrogenase [Spirochaetaceae bacterium 4572_59]
MDVHVKKEDLIRYIENIFIAKGMNEEDAGITADVLVAADARGIPSHGVGRLWRYLAGIDKGVMKLNIVPATVTETPVSLVVDAKGMMGPPVSFRTMQAVIDKAEKNGMAFSCVRDSNHFGIAGYYSMMALPKDMIGFSMTNTAALGVPTFGRNVMFGTNPISVAVPANNEASYVLDMSTTVVSRGKIEVYERLGKTIPKGWAVNEKGLSALEPGPLIESMLVQAGGGIMPLGGEGEEFAGYKGFGLAVLVDIMTAVLAGAEFGPDVVDSEATSARVSHFFGAVKLTHFRDAELFKNDMDQMLRQLKEADPAEGQKRVYYAGLKEAENEIESQRTGVPISEKVWISISESGKNLGIKRPVTI